MVVSWPGRGPGEGAREADFPDTFRTATAIRNEIQERGWNIAKILMEYYQSTLA